MHEIWQRHTQLLQALKKGKKPVHTDAPDFCVCLAYYS